MYYYLSFNSTFLGHRDVFCLVNKLRLTKSVPISVRAQNSKCGYTYCDTWYWDFCKYAEIKTDFGFEDKADTGNSPPAPAPALLSPNRQNISSLFLMYFFFQSKKHYSFLFPHFILYSSHGILNGITVHFLNISCVLSILGQSNNS
jgi:hypothetical protein